MANNQDEWKKFWEERLLKNGDYYRDSYGNLKKLKADEYIDQYGNLRKRYNYHNEDYYTSCTFEEPIEIKKGHEDGDIEDMPFILKAASVAFVIFVFLLMLAAIPKISPKASPVIVTEKRTTVVDSISRANNDKNFIETAMNEKKQAIKAVNEEIKKQNEKKALANSLKQNKKELLVVSAIVDDGFMTREIKAQAEVDSITNNEIDILSKSLESTVDSIALQIKLEKYILQQEGKNYGLARMIFGGKQRRSMLTGVMGI